MSERIGVYICHCGTNISNTVDITAVADYARTLPEVAVVREYKYMCSDPGQDMIKKDIEEDNLTRVVVSSCSPLMHENTFRSAVEDAGMNRFLFQMSNIREQCSWVHNDRGQATEKAKKMIAGAVRRVLWHKELTGREVPVEQSAVVVGAGIAGIESALKIAEAGKKVYLVEKEPSIGGHMAMFDKTFPTLDCAACILTPKMVSVGQHPNIELLTYSEVEEISGFVGNFNVKVRRKARYIDEDKCTGCGSCLERCPVKHKPEDNGHPVKEPEMTPEMKRRVDRIIDHHRHERGPLVLVLQDINLELGYLPMPCLKYVSRELNISLSMIYHVATFYKAFSLEPRGEHVIKVCLGTACHVRGAQRVLEALENRLEIKAGQTTEDRKFTLETVNCLGACAMGPVAVIDDRYLTLTPSKVDRLIKSVVSAG
ncbi:MAG: NAD(P)H-dependent oxidoreductase subunit E [Gemmatimonadota bacterium]|nr:NAD(P)H-dependent oxidoreductase subunit E [Gemmatimonadota bacterium]